MMKKWFLRTFTMIMSTLIAFSVIGCGDNSVNTGEESKTCEVKAAIAGYGVDWLAEASKAFNEIYKDEGYKIKVTLTDTSINMENEILYPKRNTTDMYFEYNKINQLVDKSRNVFKNNTDCVLEDLTDVLNSKPIGADKKEQGEKLIDRIPAEVISGYKYTGRLKNFSGYYGLPFTGGTSGIFVNEKVLDAKIYNTYIELLQNHSDMIKVMASVDDVVLDKFVKPNDPELYNTLMKVRNLSGQNKMAYDIFNNRK